MSVEKIMAVTIPLSIMAVFLGFFGLVSERQKRNQAFRMECVSKGGTVIGSGDTNHCIIAGKATP